MFTSINLDNFDSEISEEERTVLLAYIRSDYEYKDQTEVLDAVSKKYGDTIKVCLLDENTVDALRERLGIEGDPTFIGFNNGKEKGRLLGKVDAETAISFVSNKLFSDGSEKSKIRQKGGEEPPVIIS